MLVLVAMSIVFGSEYTVVVTVFVVALCFCKSVMECVQMGMLIATHCPLEHCSYQCRFDLFLYGRFALLFYSGTQPIFVCMAPFMRQLISGVYPESHVAILETAQLNVSSISTDDDFLAKAHAVVFDLQFAVVPFSVAAAVSTAIWLNLSRDGLFKSDPTWDEALFEDERIWLYEIAYYAELLAMCVALIVASSVAQSAAQTWYTGCSFTAILIFFAAAARYSNRSHAGVFMSTIAFSMQCAMLVSFAISETDASCVIAVVCSVTLVMAVSILSVLHYSAAGQLSAGSIILARTLVSNTCSLVLIATLMLGRSSACP